MPDVADDAGHGGAARPETRGRRTIHNRGEFLQPAEPVEPGRARRSCRRCRRTRRATGSALARWLVAAENPLVGRVTVNGAWQAFFGRGLVAHARGLRHPGRAADAIPSCSTGWRPSSSGRGWSQKAHAPADRHERDLPAGVEGDAASCSPATRRTSCWPAGRGSGSRPRWSATSPWRPAACSNPKIGGPSVFPPQPDGVTALAYGQAAWPTSTGADRYRRGLYTFTKRTAPFAAFATFDAPSSEVACVRRERSNTPLQALTLLNDPVFVEASQALADRVLRERGRTTEGRIRHAVPALPRPRAAEPTRSASIVEFHDRPARAAPVGRDSTPTRSPRTSRTGEPRRAGRVDAVARVLLNLDETITKE